LNRAFFLSEIDFSLPTQKKLLTAYSGYKTVKSVADFIIDASLVMAMS